MSAGSSKTVGNKNLTRDLQRAGCLPPSTAPVLIEPFSFRLPPNGSTDPFFGGARTFWNSNVLATKANKGKPPVKSVVVKQLGAKRGIRFILFSSARQFFQRLAKAQNSEEEVA